MAGSDRAGGIEASGSAVARFGSVTMSAPRVRSDRFNHEGGRTGGPSGACARRRLEHGALRRADEHERGAPVTAGQHLQPDVEPGKCFELTCGTELADVHWTKADGTTEIRNDVARGAVVGREEAVNRRPVQIGIGL